MASKLGRIHTCCPRTRSMLLRPSTWVIDRSWKRNRVEARGEERKNAKKKKTSVTKKASRSSKVENKRIEVQLRKVTPKEMDSVRYYITYVQCLSDRARTISTLGSGCTLSSPQRQTDVAAICSSFLFLFFDLFSFFFHSISVQVFREYLFIDTQRRKRTV